MGTLSMLNMTEEDYLAFVKARIRVNEQMVKESYAVLPEGAPEAPQENAEFRVIYYDTLDALLMALNAGGRRCH